MRPILYVSTFVLLVLPACGGGAASTGQTATAGATPRPRVDPNLSVPRAHARGDHEATARVGALGGTFEIGNGATLEIPAGALSQTVEVVFGLAPDTSAFNNHFDEARVGPTLMVAPELVSANGAKFVVTLPYASLPDGYTASNAEVGIEDNDTSTRGFEGGAVRTRFDLTNATADGRQMRTELARLPGMRLQFLVGR